MKDISNFSLRRLWLLVRYEIGTRRKTILDILKTLTIVMALPLAVGLIMGYNYDTYVSRSIDMLNSMQFVALAMLVCNIFGVMHKKGTMTQYLTLPASNLEKLVSQVLIYTVGIALLFVASYLILECIHYPLMAILGKPEEFRQSIAPIIFGFLSADKASPHSIQITMLIALYIVMLYSIFVNIHCKLLDWFCSYIVMLVIAVVSIYPLILIKEKFFISTTIVDGNAIDTPSDATVPLIICSAIVITVTLFLWRNTYKNFSNLSIAEPSLNPLITIKEKIFGKNK